MPPVSSLERLISGRWPFTWAIPTLPMTFVFAGLGHSFELSPVLYLSRRPHSRLSRFLHLDTKT